MPTRTRRPDVEIDLAADSAVRLALQELTRGDRDAQLEAAGRLRRAAEAMLTDLVVDARDAGATWADIGETLGVSTQAAHQKYRYVAGGSRH